MLMELPDEISMGDKYGPAMEITEQAEAAEYFAALVRHNMRISQHNIKEAMAIERENLAYWAGYYSHEVRLRVDNLFNCIHPIFGSANTPPTLLEACKLGLAGVTKRFDQPE